MHGFAYQLPWQVIERATDRLTLRLASNSQTRTSYPFEFELSLTYRLSKRGLQVEMQVHNTGDKSMPYHAGFHPYFAAPENKTGMSLDFKSANRLVYNTILCDSNGCR